MFFKFIKNKIVLDCFTCRADVFQYSKITEASQYIPNWWKNLPKPEVSFKNFDKNQVSNMRHCVGFIELFKNSFVIPMWSDLLLQIGREGTNEYRWQYADRVSSLTIHPAHQRGTYLDELKYQHFKLGSPWVLKTNRYVKFCWSGAVWNMDKPEQIIWLPAVDDYYYQTSTTINFMCKREKELTEIIIPFKQPLVYLTPMTERKVILKTHLVSENELKRVGGGMNSSCFFGSYFKQKRSKHAT